MLGVSWRRETHGLDFRRFLYSDVFAGDPPNARARQGAGQPPRPASRVRAPARYAMVCQIDLKWISGSSSASAAPAPRLGVALTRDDKRGRRFQRESAEQGMMLSRG